LGKPHKEFHQLDLTSGWVTPPGFQNDQFQQRILASDMDEKNKTGSRTRLLIVITIPIRLMFIGKSHGGE
jgi:hypothetical protein